MLTHGKDGAGPPSPSPRSSRRLSARGARGAEPGGKVTAHLVVNVSPGAKSADALPRPPCTKIVRTSHRARFESRGSFRTK